MCNGDCKCSQNLVKCPDTDAPDVVKMYWNHAALLNGAEKMKASVQGHLRTTGLDDAVYSSLGYTLSSLEVLIHNTEKAIRRMKSAGKDA